METEIDKGVVAWMNYLGLPVKMILGKDMMEKVKFLYSRKCKSPRVKTRDARIVTPSKKMTSTACASPSVQPNNQPTSSR
jgi:hypothetical protein